jgi:catechol 2,3-dioxygenase-like lactoylglutathione lyase family enzyme
MADLILDKPTFVGGAARQKTLGSNMGLATLNHFGVSVRDVERSIAFYKALTGEEPIGRGKWSSVGLGQAAGMKGPGDDHLGGIPSEQHQHRSAPGRRAQYAPVGVCARG